MALRRACTFFTITTLAVGLAATVVPGPAGADGSGVGVVQDLLTTTKFGLVTAGSSGVAGGSTTERTTIDPDPATSVAEASDGSLYVSGPGGLRHVTTSVTDGVSSILVTPVGVGDRACLGDVAVTDLAVWVVSSCNAGEDPGTPTVLAVNADGVRSGAVDLSPVAGDVRLASVPRKPDLLAVSDHVNGQIEQEFEPPKDAVLGRARTFDTAAASFPLTTTTVPPVTFGDGTGTPTLALSPNGDQLAGGSGRRSAITSTSTGEAVWYLADLPVQDVAWTADGSYLAVAYGDGTDVTPSVSIMRQAGFVYVGNRSVTGTAPVRLAWTGTALDVSASDGTTSTITTHTDARRITVSVDQAQQTGGYYWDAYTVITGTLRSPGYNGLPGLKLSVTRKNSAGVTTPLASVITNAEGVFTIRDRPGIAGRYTYTVTRPGNDLYTAVNAEVSSYVEKHSNRLWVNTDRFTYTAGQRAVITVRLQHFHTNRTVRVYASGANRRGFLLRTGTVNSDGVFRFVVYMPYHSHFSARWSGDDRYTAYTANTIHRWVRARVGTAVSKPLTRSGGYNVYRAGKSMTQGVRITPYYTGEQVSFTAQQLVRGSWRLWGTGTARVDKNGDAFIGFKGARGVKYRLRGSAIGNNLAYGANGAWQYVTFR